MNMKNFTKSLLLLATIGILNACSEAFLDIDPQGKLDGVTLANRAGVDAALTGAYAMLDGWHNEWESISPPWAAAGSNWIWGSVVSDDAYKGGQYGAMSEISSIESFDWSPDDPYLNARFKALYEGVARVNAAQKLLEDAHDFSPTEWEAKEGEICFLRAHFHFEAWKMWGNIPYLSGLDTAVSKMNNYKPIEGIIADLKKAVNQLPEDQAEVGRATRGAAIAYLGKVYLYNGKYHKAKEQFDAVVASGKYALQDCFHDIFTTDGENGAGMIFSIQASVNDGTAGSENGNFGDQLNFPDGDSPFGCCGFHQPSQNLVNAFRVDVQGLPMLDDFNNRNLLVSDVVDPRIDWTIGRDGVPFLDWGPQDGSWIRSRSWSGPFSPKKFIYRKGEQSTAAWSGTQLSPVNIPIFRYADVLLMLAECEVELGNLTKARELVNRIRLRAANCAQGPDGGETSLDDAGINWASYKIGIYNQAWTDQAFARKAVRMERRLELALEGHRFFDLRRWGIAREVMNDYLETEKFQRSYLETASPFEEKHMLYPLPNQQLELSGGWKLSQNPGW